MPNKKERRIVLSVAGFDPCGGAGVLADIKVLEQHRLQGMAVLTANTIQTGESVAEISWIDIAFVQKSVKTLMARYAISVVKIGIVQNLLHLDAILEVVRAHNRDAFIIWDPVLRSSSGFTFFTATGTEFGAAVLRRVDLVTPNLEEYAYFRHFFEDAGRPALLLTGGHCKVSRGVDTLYQGEDPVRFSPQVASVLPKHGSGCVLSASIAAHIAQGAGLEEACRKAKQYTERFLNSHPSLLGTHYDNH